MKKVMRFSKSGVSVSIANLSNGRFIAFKGDNESISPETEFGKKMIGVNSAGKLNRKENWENFKYNLKSNIWFRELKSFSIDDIAPHFIGDFEIVNVNEGLLTQPSAYQSEVRFDDARINATDNANLDRTGSDITSGGGSNNSVLDEKAKSNRNVVELRARENHFRNDQTEGNKLPREIRPADGLFNRNTNGQSGKPIARPIGDLGRTDSTGRNGSIGNHVASENSVNAAGQNKKIRIIQNVEAVKLVKELQSEKRLPTKGEIQVLERYSGWGGLADVVASGEAELFIGEQLSLSEKRHLIDSAFTGYYTVGKLIEAQWNMLERAGFFGGRVCEPSAGIGRYISHRPTKFDKDTHFTAVEIDDLSAQIAKYLHPAADVLAEPFELSYRTRINTQKFDLVIGNVPFGEKRIIDHITGDSLSIHNYFIKSAIDMLSAGGITSLITSTYTMDSVGNELRQYLNENAQLLSIVRTPQGCFDGTEVMTDILTFRKKAFDESDKNFKSIPFVDTVQLDLAAGGNFRYEVNGKELRAEKGKTIIGVTVNECFAQGHPNVIMVGEKRAMSSMGGRVVLSLYGTIENVITSLSSISPAHSMDMGTGSKSWFNEKTEFAKSGYPKLDIYYDKITDERLMPGTLFLNDGDPSIVTSCTSLAGTGYGVSLKSVQFRGYTNRWGQKVDPVSLVRDYVELRDLIGETLRSQKEEGKESDDRFNKNLNDLNRVYDSFEKKYGYFFDKEVRRILSVDSQFGLCLGLTEYDSESDTVKKARIFFEKTVNFKKEPDAASSLNDAATISLMKHGEINVELIEKLLSKTIKASIAAEPGIVFFNPESRKYEHFTKYLVGNVIDKLEKAKAHQEANPIVAYNIEPLVSVQPPYTYVKDIEVGMGAGWLPKGIVPDFVEHIFQADDAQVQAIVNIYGSTNDEENGLEVSASITPNSGSDAQFNLCNIQTWGGNTFDFTRVLIAAIKGTSISIKIDGVYSEEESRKANQKVELLNREWSKFYKSHEIHSVILEETYNKVVNCFNYEVDYSKVDYQFPDLNNEFIPRSNQKSFVLGALNRNLCLNGDPTGGGKTGCEVILAYELKRLGFAKLPVIVVPNHMLYQMTSEAQQIYPTARICMITKADLVKENRLAFISKMTMNDWDFAVITYGLFKELKAPEQYLYSVLMESISALNERAESVSSRRERRRILKLISAKLDKYEQEQEARNREGTYFDILNSGIDAVIYDEVHYLKNLELDMVDEIAGVSSSVGSAISANEYAKMNFIRDYYYNGEEFGVFGLSATLISNQASELYTLFRQFKPSALKREGIHNFNQWVAQYGLIENCLEVKPEGKGYQYKLRLCGYKNMPELLSNFRSFTQANLLENIGVKVPHCEEKSIVVEPNIWQQYIFNLLFERAKRIRDGVPDFITKFNSKGVLVGYEDILLTVLNDATLASISATALYDWIKPDGLNDKLQVAAKTCADLYLKSGATKSAQLVFLDKSVPKPKEWNGYSQLKRNMVEQGVASEDIEFIHSAKTDIQRDNLFSKVRNGMVRFLIGSTDKMGTGTNVQKKLIAGHDIDLPWRPDQLIQRYGRVIRSGNEHSSVHWVRYLTKGSMDVFRLETLKRKAAYIAAAMSSPRSVERIYRPEEKLDFDSMVEAVSENPVVKEKAKIESTIKKMEFERDDYIDSKRRLELTILRNESSLKSSMRHAESLGRIRMLRDEFVSANRSSPSAIPEDATKALSGYIQAFDNAKKARLELDGNITKIGEKGRREELQAAQTTYLSLSSMSQSLTHALVENDEDRIIGGRVFGFNVQFSMKSSASGAEFNLTRAKVLDPTAPSSVLLEVIHQGSYPGYVLTKLVSSLGVELNENHNSHTTNVRYHKDVINGARAKLRALVPSFDEDQLIDLYKRRGEIAVKVMQALNEQFSNDGFSLPNIEKVKAEYLKSGCDPQFNPFTCRIEKDLNPNAKYTPVAQLVDMHESEERFQSALSFN